MADTLNEALEAALSQNDSETSSERSPLVIDNDLRTITVPADYVFGVYNDKDVLSVPFKMPRTYDDIDLSDFMIQINFINASGIGSIYEVPEKTVSEEEIEFEWLLGSAVFTAEGTVTFIVCMRQIEEATGKILKEFNTTIARGTVLAGIEVEDPSDPEQYSILTQMRNLRASAEESANTAADAAEAAAVSEQTARLFLGAPLTASAAANMTDQTRIYVYTGSEEGYKFGYWYYYDGGAWTEGGVYNSSAVNTDTTLTVAGAPADSKTVGTALTNLDNKTNEADNRIASIDAKISDIEMALEDVSIDPNDLGLYQNPDTFYVYPTYRDVRSENGIPLANSGGGGGGGEVIDAKFTASKITDWNAKTITDGAECKVYFTWSSIENDAPTGDGTVRITVNNVVRASYQIQQGDVTVDLTSYIQNGSNKVLVRISDVYDQAKTYAFTITSIALSISSSFDMATPYYGNIQVPYVPVGAVEKTVHFIVDGNEVGTQQTAVSNKQLTYTIPAQTHGGHSLKIYFESEINAELVRSNELYFEFMSVELGNNETIITSPYNDFEIEQYTSAVVPFRVYTQNKDTTDIEIYLNSEKVSSQSVDRTEQRYTLKANDVGTTVLEIKAGTTTKTFNFTITESQIDVAPETEGLKLHLTAQGRSNNEENPGTWENNGISATFTNFLFRRDGWQKDSDGIDVLRTVSDARVTIPYNIFSKDIKQNGFTFEIEFATRDVFDYSAVIASCFSDNIGFKITPQMITFKGAQTELSTLYKDNEHIRLGITVSKQTEYRLILLYINGVASRAIQYASGERFSQPNPVGITIGSNDCGVDIYTIRVYENNLSMQQMLENFIADTPIGSIMLERYLRNNVYNEYGEITKELLPSYLPYMIIECEQLPQYKGDKKIAKGSYTNPLLPSKSFTFENCQINVQGTSSSVYYIKNLDMQYKGGFKTSSGDISLYPLRDGSIPFNRFVLKADVASSESYNNVGLAMYYNDLCPYKTREMEENPKVRHGIEGIPIVMFWYNPTTAETTFMGKYNFNLPKRAPTPLGYHDNMQSWEWERNNSDNVKFKDDDFTSTSWDEVAQEYYPTWYDDFEARMPSDEWRDYTMLKELISWVKSTDRTQATNEALPEPVTYKLNTTITVTPYPDDTSYTVEDEMDGGVATGYKFFTFTKDTPAYRLTKFRAELGYRMEIDSAVFYYIFTEFFLMIDSRAKNMFIGFKGSDVTLEGSAIDRKAVLEPYDMDTAIGTNNSGVLMFDYTLEDTDTVSGVISGDTSGSSNAPVFNAQDSVLWVNLRDSFRAEITVMYRNLRASGNFSYKVIEARYEDHQSKWGEAISNEDAEVKYLTPLINPVTVDETTGELIRTDRYLTMLQGMKTEQRKWWLSNRFRYMDSKYVTGDAASSTISARLFNSGTLTITTAIDMYVGVSFGGGTTVSLSRTKANTPVEFTYTAPSGVTEMETWIYSADLITGVGDLSVFYPNELDFSKATRLKSLKIGDGAEGYSNANMKVLDVRNCALLESIDVRNCPNLAITVDLENSPRLKSALFEGTAITGIELADGGEITTLHLPGTITTLTLLNLTKLSDFTLPDYSNISRLMLANIDDTIVDPVAILKAIQPNSQVNIQGLSLEMENAAAIDEFLDLLDTMIGVTREKNADGEWIYHEYETAQVSGTIHTTSLTGDQKESFNARYPYISVTADYTETTLTFMSYDGSTVLKAVTCLNGVPSEAAPEVPARPNSSDGHYSYSALGWNTTYDSQTADASAITDVTANRTVYPAYKWNVRTYTVTWKNGTATLRTDSNVAWGTTPSWGQAMPKNSDNQTATGWTPAIAAITSDTTYTATYKPMYTITFVRASADGGGTLQTVRVEEGTVPAYTGSTPTTTQGDATDYPFEGWTPTIVAATANATYTAKFGSPVEVAEIADSWDTIIANIDNGTYSSVYKVGNYKPLDLGTEGTINMQIVGFDVDTLASGGTAPITFIGMELLNTRHRINPEKTAGTEGTGTLGGWEKSEMRSYLKNTVKPLITTANANVAARIQRVVKISNAYNVSGVAFQQTTTDDVWIPGHREIFNSTDYDKTGPVYKTIYNDKASRIKKRNGSGYRWWLRSAHSDIRSRLADDDGSDYYYLTSAAFGVALGFCLGLEPETIEDSWETILANENPSASYSIGDTKYVDLGTEGKHLMEIVAFDEDDKADGSGKAKITWISKTLLNTTHRMNPAKSSGTEGTGTLGGWEKSKMRSYLKNTIKPLIPEVVRNSIVEVTKISNAYDTSEAAFQQTTTDDVWIPGHREIFNSTTYDQSGAVYSSKFNSAANRIKKRNASANTWWLRSAGSATFFRSVYSSGYDNSTTANYAIGVALGFCTD